MKNKKRAELMFHATIRMDIAPQKEKEALEILLSIAERTRVESGCISCRIYRDVQEDHGIMMEEFWKNREAFERHLRSSDYRSVLLVVEMAEGPPEIRFNVIAQSSGVETIERARGTGHERKANAEGWNK